MENVFYLFPVKEGLPDSYAHPILQRAKDFDEEDVLACLRDVCNLDDILQCVTRNKQSFYFSDNVKDFSAGIKNEHDYPTPLTRIRRRFSRQMSDAVRIVRYFSLLCQEKICLPVLCVVICPGKLKDLHCVYFPSTPIIKPLKCE